MVSRSWAEEIWSLGMVLLRVVPNGAPASSWRGERGWRYVGGEVDGWEWVIEENSRYLNREIALCPCVRKSEREINLLCFYWGNTMPRDVGLHQRLCTQSKLLMAHITRYKTAVTSPCCSFSPRRTRVSDGKPLKPYILCRIHHTNDIPPNIQGWTFFMFVLEQCG